MKVTKMCLCVWVSVLLAFTTLCNHGVSSNPVEGLLEKSQDGSSISDKYPVMIPVSSTVIPLMHLFGKPKPLRSSTQHPRSSLYLSPERRARLLERSNRPDAPVRLITKNSRQKDQTNETY